MLPSMRRAAADSDAKKLPLDEARLLARWRRTQDDFGAAAAIASAAQDAAPTTKAKRYYAPAGGDFERLRGIPAIGRGVSGASPGTKPGSSLS